VMFMTLSSKLSHQLRLYAKGKARNFDEVIGMVDNMVELEGKEQGADDKEKPWCNGEFDKKDREEKGENHEIEKLEAEIEQENDELEAIEEEIKTAKTEIAELDKSVAEATETRKEEHEEYKESAQLSQTAIELIYKAKQRLLKFYNPTLYKAAPVRKEMTMEEKIIEAGSMFAQVKAGGLRVARVAPLDMPDTFGAYEKKSEKSSGVIGLMDMISKELEGDMKDAEYEEKTSQADYTKLMSGSQEARAQNVKAIADKSAAVASVRDKRFQAKQKELQDLQDLEIIRGYVQDLHGSCDFILENYDVRKEARAQEIEALKNAKATLAGANLR